jgi:hypothetical protein
MTHNEIPTENSSFLMISKLSANVSPPLMNEGGRCSVTHAGAQLSDFMMFLQSKDLTLDHSSSSTQQTGAYRACVYASGPFGTPEGRRNEGSELDEY